MGFYDSHDRSGENVFFVGAFLQILWRQRQTLKKSDVPMEEARLLRLSRPNLFSLPISDQNWSWFSNKAIFPNREEEQGFAGIHAECHLC